MNRFLLVNSLSTTSSTKPLVQEIPNHVRLKLQVKAPSPETRLIMDSDHTLTIHVAAPPVKGKANREIVKWLAKKTGKSSSQIRIIAGFYSKSKVIEVRNVSKAELAALLQVDPQALSEVSDA